MFNLGLLDYPAGQCSNMFQRKNLSTERILCDNKMAMLDRINGQKKMMFQCSWACQFTRKPLSKMKCLPMQIMNVVISRKMSEMQGNQVLMFPHITSNRGQEVLPEQE